MWRGACEPFELLHAAPEVVRAQVGVARRHLHVAVPERLFQVVELTAAHHVMTGEGVPHVMRSEADAAAVLEHQHLPAVVLLLVDAAVTVERLRAPGMDQVDRQRDDELANTAAEYRTTVVGAGRRLPLSSQRQRARKQTNAQQNRRRGLGNRGGRNAVRNPSQRERARRRTDVRDVKSKAHI